MLILPLLAWPLTATAHHSFTMFDQTKQVTITGTVTEFQWTNPHAYIEIDIPGEGGAVKHWSIEMGSPGILMQGGWKFKDLKAGDKVTIIANPLRDGRLGGLLVQVTLPDGRVLGNGIGRGPAPPARGTCSPGPRRAPGPTSTSTRSVSVGPALLSSPPVPDTGSLAAVRACWLTLSEAGG
jgi:hypothetical protein